uniref:Thioredoxin domain-containing protein 11 n=2 Tax=Lygus hesperus TaxID=30085 RepID=A0A0A9X359_LYGHE
MDELNSPGISKRPRPPTSPSDSPPEKQTPKKRMAPGLDAETKAQIAALVVAGINEAIAKSNLVTKTDLDSLCALVQGVKEDSGKLRAEVASLKEVNIKLNTVVSSLKEENYVLRSRLDGLDRQLRQDRITITGLTLQNKDNVIAETKKFLSSIAGHTVELKTAYVPYSSVGGRDIVVAHLTDETKVHPILVSSGSKLKATGIKIARDMPPDMRKRSNRMLRLRWEIRKLCPDKKPTVSYDVLKLAGRRFVWKEDSLLCGDEDGTAVLRDITGKDMTSTITEIVKFRPDRARNTSR